MSSIDASTVGSLSQSPSPIRSARSSPPASSRAPSAASVDAPTPAASSRASTPISTPPRRRPPTTPSASPLTTPDDSPVRPPADSPITTPASSAQQSPQQSPVRDNGSPARDGAAPAPVSVGSDGSPHSTGLPDVSSVHVARGGGEPSAVDPTAGSLSPSSSVHHKTTTSVGQDGPPGGALQDTTGTLGDIGTSSIAMPSAHSDPSFSVSAATADHLPPPAPAHAHSASAGQHSTSGSRHRSASGVQGHSSQRLSLSSAFGTGAASIVRGPDGVLRDNAPDFGGCFGGIAPHYVPLEPRMAESPAAWRPDASPRDLGAGRSLFGGVSPVRDQHHPHGSTALSFSPQSAGRGRDAEHLPGSTALSPVPAAPGSGPGAELRGASIGGSHAHTSGSRVSASGVRVSVVHGFEVADYSSSEHSWSGDEVTGSPSRGPPPRIERDPSLQRGFTAAPIAADGGAPADALLSPRWSPTGAATPNRPPLHPTTAATGTGSVSSTATPHRPAPTPSPHHAASLYGRAAELAEYPSTPLAQRSGTAGHGTPESAQRQSLLLPAAANASPMRAQLGTTCDGGLTAVLPEASPSQHSQHSPVYAGAHSVPAAAAAAPIPAPGPYDRPLGHHGRGDSIGSPSYASPYYAGGSAGLPSAGLPSASFSRQAAEIVSALSDHHDHHASRHTHSGTQHSAASLLGVSPVLAARHGVATATGSSASRTDSGRARVRPFSADAASPTRQPAPAPAPMEAGPRDANVIGLLEDFIRALRQDERMGAAAAAARGEYAPPAPLASPPPASYDLPPPPLPPLPPLPGQRGPEAYAPHGAVPAALLQPPAPTHGCELDAVGDFAYYAPGLGKRQGPAAVVGRSYGASLSSYGTAEAALRSDPAVHGVYPGGLSGEAAPRLSSFDRVLLAQARARWGASPYAAHC